MGRSGIPMKALLLSLMSFAMNINASSTTKPAAIREIHQFAKLLEHAKDKNTIVIVSLDNTLVKSPLQMGQRSWYYHRKNVHAKNGLQEPLATQRAVAEWTAVLNLFGQQVVAPDVASTVDTLQKKLIKVVGVSSRGLGLASITVQHLAQAGINLSRNSEAHGDVPMVLGEKLLLYRNGILFTSGVGKAIALKKLHELSKISQPKKIVMVSHDERTLKIVAEGMFYHLKEIEFVPLRYTAMDKELKAFDAKVADAQFENLMNVMSDQAARKKIAEAAAVRVAQ